MSETILTLRYERGRKTWVKLIIAYAADKFIGPFQESDWQDVYVLDPDQPYEVCELDEMRYVVSIDGALKELTKEQVLALLRLAEQERAKRSETN